MNVAFPERSTAWNRQGERVVPCWDLQDAEDSIDVRDRAEPLGRIAGGGRSKRDRHAADCLSGVIDQASLQGRHGGQLPRHTLLQGGSSLDLLRRAALRSRRCSLSTRVDSKSGGDQARANPPASDVASLPRELRARNDHGQNCGHEQLTAMHESLPVNSPVLSAERTMPLEHHNRRKAGEKTLALS